jgi:hypoxanthine phosphoribosyltransferase
MTSKDLDRILYKPSDLELIVNRIAQNIKSNVCPDKGKRLVLLAPLKGSYIFLSDLSRRLNHYEVPHIVEFMSVKSYSNTSSSGFIQILCDCREDLEGDHVIVIEDIVDSGLTLQKLVEILKKKNPKTLELCTLLRKPAQLKVAVHVDYVGVDIGSHFVVGYGLDYNEWFRGLDCIGIPTPEAIEKYKQ